MVLPSHVMVVEDDAVLALAIEQTLRDAGVVEVEICATTTQAMKALAANKPELVILDVHLADSDDGWAIAELVESLKPKAPQIIFSTGAPQDIPDRIAELGQVLAKPYEPEQLIALIRQPRAKGLMSRLRDAIR